MSRFVEKEGKNGKKVCFVKCLVRQKEIQLKPEEVIRQLFLDKLINEYGYPISRIQLEFSVHFGRDVKRADIVIMDEDRPTVPYVIVEVKKPKLKDGKEQLKSYCNSTGAPIAVWTNGEQIAYYNRKDPNYFEDIRDIPKASQTLMDVISERWTIEDLKANIDKIDKDYLFITHTIGDGEEDYILQHIPEEIKKQFKTIIVNDAGCVISTHCGKNTIGILYIKNEQVTE